MPAMPPELFKAAKAARFRAHAPYSGFKVGAALIADDGRIYAGCNIENAAYPNGICAETAAIAAMIGGTGRRIREIAVIGAGRALATPCGGCRQRIAEFATRETRIHVCGLSGRRRSFRLGELLPASFALARRR